MRVSICHCLACQQRTGSAYGYQARFAEDQVVISGESRAWTRASDEERSPRTSSFCPHCGSTVFWRGEDSPGFIGVAAGAFADPAFPAPTRSVWEERKHSWVILPPDIEHIH